MQNSKSENLKLFYFLKSITSLGDVRIRRIAEKFNNLGHLFSSDLQTLKSIDDISEKTLREMESAVNKSNVFEESYLKLLEKLEKSNIKVTTIFDENYPQNLKNIYDAPVILYYYGNMSESDRYSIGIVGTRTASDYRL